MPLPDVAVECGLAVDLELVNVNVVVEDLLRGFDQPRMASEPAVSVVVGVRREVGTHGIAVFFAYILGPQFGVEFRHFRVERPDLGGREVPREKQITLAVIFLDLGGC